MHFLQQITILLTAAHLWGCGKGVDAVAQNGLCDAYPVLEESPYILPIAVGSEVTLTQGNCSSVSHFSRDRYAFDFDMKTGTEILAIRAGQVIKSVESFDDDNGCPDANYLSVRHDDGTVANYYHLTKDGALKDSDQTVAQGELIAYSGNTGCSSGPHLHVAVQESENELSTIPVTFRNTSPPHRQLQAGSTYTALPY